MDLESRLSWTDDVRRGIRKIGYFTVLGLTGISGLSCDINLGAPGGRLGCLPCPTLITTYVGKDTTRHQRGMVYTCRSGHIDLAHLYKYAEWIESLSKMAFKNLMSGKQEFSFKVMEPSIYYVELCYPEHWDSLDEAHKREIAEQVSITLGGHFSYISSIWHETLTWFGWRSTLIISEFSSAFSWEDSFSNVFGCYVGSLALREKEHSFNDALCVVLGREFGRLGIQPKEVARNAALSVKGKWYEDYLSYTDMKVRNLDMGLADGKVHPSIPLIAECAGAEAWACPIPNVNSIAQYGFSLERFEIEPRVWEGRKILGIIDSGYTGNKKTINVELDFPRMMDYIKNDAIKRGYIVN